MTARTRLRPARGLGGAQGLRELRLVESVEFVGTALDQWWFSPSSPPPWSSPGGSSCPPRPSPWSSVAVGEGVAVGEPGPPPRPWLSASGAVVAVATPSAHCTDTFRSSATSLSNRTLTTDAGPKTGSSARNPVFGLHRKRVVTFPLHRTTTVPASCAQGLRAVSRLGGVRQRRVRRRYGRRQSRQMPRHVLLTQYVVTVPGRRGRHGRRPCANGDNRRDASQRQADPSVSHVHHRAARRAKSRLSGCQALPLDLWYGLARG